MQAIEEPPKMKFLAVFMVLWKLALKDFVAANAKDTDLAFCLSSK